LRQLQGDLGGGAVALGLPAKPLVVTWIMALRGRRWLDGTAVARWARGCSS
jgi:hypothetical protein